MRKLINVTYANARQMTEKQKDDLLIPEKYYGSVAIETWNVSDELKLKGVCVAGGISNYLLGLGEFKKESAFVNCTDSEDSE